MKTIYVKQLVRNTAAKCRIPGFAACLVLVAALAVAVMSRGIVQMRTWKQIQQTERIYAAEVTAEEVQISAEKPENWGLGFGKSGEKPTGNTSPKDLAAYDAYFIGEGDEKILYLTFDCGFENGNTEAILDALKKHDAPATFFVVGHYLETAPELVKRMAEEGHLVGNHTYHHPDMSRISSEEAFRKEMDDTASLYREITGEDMPMFYRPPQGKYSRENLAMAKKLGYSTFFWSLAYVDWKQDAQPAPEEALKKLTDRVHPGAIVLLHNTSKTNGRILDELLSKWEEMGYTFRPLTDFTEEKTSPDNA